MPKVALGPPHLHFSICVTALTQLDRYTQASYIHLHSQKITIQIENISDRVGATLCVPPKQTQLLNGIVISMWVFIVLLYVIHLINSKCISLLWIAIRKYLRLTVCKNKWFV